ncbi:peptidase, families S8 and S53/proprotein convertase P-domain protein [Lysobacter enzymogenes]|uniref:Peptidase, families S8 and S53/proprotein convertase P-domain protein n=1 Tax=Lysobacter enzymogenes TaxID=69 RepID=A0A0S2DKP2_LYSEN|nr:peptidase, families S8 and S53/proprotein convertase P-domain protein [Lysobacter enzymogenes]
MRAGADNVRWRAGHRLFSRIAALKGVITNMSLHSNRRHRVHVLAAATAFALGAIAAAPAFAGQAEVAGLKAGQSYGRLIVKFKDSAPATASVARSASALGAIDAVLDRAAARVVLPAASKGKKLGLQRLRRMTLGADVIVTDQGMNSEEARALIQQLASDSSVDWVQPDYIMQAWAVPNDTRFGEQWHYADSAAGIRAPTAWNTTTGTGVVVAVVDSGIVSHTDLNGNVLPGYDFVSSIAGGACSRGADCGASEDGNGRDGDPLDSSAATSSVHGTHVAGTVGAVTNNATGVAGVAYGARVVPIRALGKYGSGATSDIVDAIVWASGGSVPGAPANANPAEVINLSLGLDLPCSQMPAYQQAINTATANGAIVVAAAGNSNIDSAGATPVGCNNVIGVAASDQAGNRAFYSSYGGAIDITAPGGETCSPDTEFLPLGAAPSCTRSHPAQGILSTVNGNGYGFMQGTSMAAPHVAGVVALIQAASPTPKTFEQVRQLLASTARPIPASQCPGGCGPGLVDAAAAVVAAAGSTGPGPGTGAQTYNSTGAVAIPDNNAAGATSSIVVSGRSGNAPSDSKVTLNIVHSYRGDLIVDLLAPDGSVYNLHNRSGAGADNVTGTFTVNLSSEALNGTWRLRAADRAAQDTGQIQSWSLNF